LFFLSNCPNHAQILNVWAHIMSLAFVFPGQGSQSVGMGAQLAADFTTAKAVFAEVDEALSQNLTRLMFEGPEDALTLTQNAQPALMAVSLAVVRVLETDFGIKMSAAKFGAGHSLGEYSAHAAAGSFSLTETARLLRLRGQAMQQAVSVGVGAMAALIGPNADLELAEAAVKIGLQSGICAIANDNNAGQIVISGHKASVEAAIEAAKALGAKAMLLNVSAPFHCSLMAPATQAMRDAFVGLSLNDPAFKIVANVTARPIEDKSDTLDLLIRQVEGRVRWRESVQWLATQGTVMRFAELGVGKILTGIIKRIVPDAHAIALNSAADFEAFAASLDKDV
jgi:[acyl-carrier-protein] S-malonyltransferase